MAIRWGKVSCKDCMFTGLSYDTKTPMCGCNPIRGMVPATKVCDFFKRSNIYMRTMMEIGGHSTLVVRKTEVTLWLNGD